MTSFTREAYVAVMQLLRHARLRAVTWKTDFEPGLQGAIEETFGDLAGFNISGCLWHYIVKVSEAVQVYELVPLFQENEEVLRPFLRRMCTLPRLEARFMRAGYNLVKADLQGRAPQLYNQLLRYFQYMEYQWLGRVGTGRLSVWGSFHATNNTAETNHKHVLRDVLGKIPVLSTLDITGTHDAGQCRFLKMRAILRTN